MIRFLLLIAMVSLSAAAPATIRVPSPPVFKLPALTGRVVDNADLLAQDRKALLTWALTETQRATQHQLVVVTLPSLNGTSIEQMGLALGNGWGIGRKGHDDGVLLLVAPNERKVRIEVGRGLEKTLTDAEAAAIIQQRILPRFRRGAMAAGILSGSAGIIREISSSGAMR